MSPFLCVKLLSKEVFWWIKGMARHDVLRCAYNSYKQLTKFEIQSKYNFRRMYSLLKLIFKELLQYQSFALTFSFITLKHFLKKHLFFMKIIRNLCWEIFQREVRFESLQRMYLDLYRLYKNIFFPQWFCVFFFVLLWKTLISNIHCSEKKLIQCNFTECYLKKAF